MGNKEFNMHKHKHMGSTLKIITAIVIIAALSWKAYPPYAYGTWSPTLTDGTNSSGATVDGGRYTRVGNIVTFSLTITTTTSAGASATTVTATLPVASNFTNTTQASGTNSGLRGSVTSNASDILNIDWTSNTGGSETITITGQYIIL